MVSLEVYRVLVVRGCAYVCRAEAGAAVQGRGDCGERRGGNSEDNRQHEEEEK